VEAVHSALNKVKRVRGLITAYNTNIDAVKHVQGADVEAILRSDEKLRLEVLGKLGNPVGEVNDVPDILAGLLQHMQGGVGGERLIQSEEVFQWLNRTLGYDELRMGGQAGIMANVLATLGVPFVVPHVAQLPRVQAGLFMGNGNIRVPTFNGRDIVFKPPLEAVRPYDKQLIHWILDFNAGAEVALNALKVKAPRSNRFIATYDDDNTEISVNTSFLEGALKIVGRIDGVIVSGYHLLKRTYRDGSGFLEKIEVTLHQLTDWKTVNPCLKMHLELGSLHDPDIARAILEQVTPLFNSLGLNEDELRDSLGFLGCGKLAEALRDTPTAPKVYAGAKQLQRRLGIQRVNVHTRDFSLTLLKPSHWASSRSELEALLLGAEAAANRAATGRFMTLEELKEAVKEPFPGLSVEGLKQFEALADVLGEAGEGVEKTFLGQGFTVLDDVSVVFIPSKVVEKPLSTVGLGDAMTSASFLLSLAAAHSMLG